MQTLDKRLLKQLSAELTSLASNMLDLEAARLKQPTAIHEAHRRSARNLVHYLALRQLDLRPLQSQLALLGLSSLGRAESHVLSTVLTVHRALNALLGASGPVPCPEDPPIEFEEGIQLLNANTEALLGPTPSGRKVRIMVTMSSEASTNYELVRDLVRNGMDCMRINCAHDNPDAWLGMIRNLRKAREETGRDCRILMDVAGPKLRTGPIEPGPSVIKCRPKRDVYGRVVAPARVWLTPNLSRERAPATDVVSIPVSASFLKHLRPGDAIHLRDARRAQRTLHTSQVVGRGCWAEAKKTIYFMPGLTMNAKSADSGVPTKRRTRIGKLPVLPQTLLLKTGDQLILHREGILGKPAAYSKTGVLISPAQISVSLPQMLDHAKPGEPVWLDDGKIGGVFREVGSDFATVEITQAHPEGQSLGAEKGVNLPETRIDISALTPDDLEALKFIVEHADIVGYSFVRTQSDVTQLLDHLEKLGGEHLGLILKIETRKSFDNLPSLILAAMRTRSLGIMIARGDLAVECGYQRLAEVQEEILWISEAAHIPVVWATQVLENLAKKGIPSRSEITDAAMGERAECVMLNKGSYLAMAVKVLADILTRMQAHHEKKRAMLRQLHLATGLSTTA
ncbi:pyruvate kinase [Edaphobacter aggregans]|uniref:pyruvate kinase n=1 Tax=Edaphobacter aggregans TaxID=570835 RepID=UPI000552BC70|nr:pyruvate kinase [Edaphobacter aggregans]